MSQERENLEQQENLQQNQQEPQEIVVTDQNHIPQDPPENPQMQEENHEQIVVEGQQNAQQKQVPHEKMEDQDQEIEEKAEQKREIPEDGEDEAVQENEDNDKNIRKQSSDSIRESRENETSQLGGGGGKKCFNKLCTSKKIHKKIRSKVEAAKYRFLCKNCYDNYVNNFFCQFCEQIYSNQDHDEQDMNRWVGCDSCDRWNHIECEKRNRHKNIQVNKDFKYECLTCSRKSRNGGNMEQIPKKKIEREYDGPGLMRNRGQKFQINKDERISIFHKKPQNFPNLQPFLQGFNFRLWINEALIRDDLDNLRTLVRRPPMEEEPKKIKKIKQD